MERLRDTDFPELEFNGDGYRAQVTGEPCIKLDMTISSLPGFTGDSVAVVSAMFAVNAIPAVRQAPPGVMSMRELRPFPSRNPA